MLSDRLLFGDPTGNVANHRIYIHIVIYYPSGEFSNQTIKLALYKQNRHSKLFPPTKHYKTLQD